MRYYISQVTHYFAVVAPFMYAHFLAHQVYVWRRADAHVLLLAGKMHGYSSLVPMRNSSDHILRTKGSITTNPARCAAAIHSRITTTEHDHIFAYLVSMFKSYICEPVDADMNVCSSFLPAGNVKVAALGRS